MKNTIFIIFILSCSFYKLSAQSTSVKQNLYFALDSNANYLYSYRQLTKKDKSDLAITFNKTCLTLHYRPTFYRYRNSICTIKKTTFLKKKLHILSYNEFIDFICNTKYDVQLEKNYNIYFIENKSNKKYLVYKVLRTTPVVENY